MHLVLIVNSYFWAHNSYLWHEWSNLITQRMALEPGRQGEVNAVFKENKKRKRQKNR